MNYYELPCGCKFKVLDENVKENDGLPSLDFDFYHIQNCSKVWELLASGDTKGIFQLESQLGQEWSSKLKPETIDEIAMLTSIIRPGTLESQINGKSMTQCFVDRKHGIDEAVPLHPALNDMLIDTYNLSCFQEQSIQIVKDIAGFSEGLAETFRRSVSKKDVKKMAELKPKFIQGCIDNGLTKKDGEEIFDILEKSERYGFNRSVCEDTYVHCKDGIYKKINEIKIGEHIQSPYGFVKVINLYNHGEQEVFHVTLSSGYQIKCTIVHKFLCEDGFVRTLGEIISKDIKIVTKEKRTDRISNIKRLGLKQTYDIEVQSKNHIYYGNGIATSNSHATIYSYLTYITAFIKYHFPTLFFTAWLHLSKEKINPTEERRELISDAKRWDINILPPTLKYLTKGYGTEFFNKGNNIYFGLIDIKSIGYKNISCLIKSIFTLENKYKKNVSEVDWFTFLCNVGRDNDKTVINNLILVGATPGTESRKKKVVEFKNYKKLNDKEQKWLSDNHQYFKSLSESLKAYLKVDKKDNGPYNVKSVEKIENIIDSLDSKAYNLEDDISWISTNETHLMGLSLSSHILEDYDNFGDTTCKEIYEGKGSGNILCVISQIKTTVTKNGKNPGQEMCFLKLEDKSGSVDAVCFPNIYCKEKDIIYEGSVVLCGLKKSGGKSAQVTSLARG